MRIVNKEEFYKLPVGTLFSRYAPSYIDGLNVKGETWYKSSDKTPFDYIELDLAGCVDANDSAEYFDKLDGAHLRKETFEMDYELYQRNGLYDKNEMFVIYERTDVEKLINYLQNTCL